MSAPTDPTKERSQHEDDVLERIAKIVTRDTIPRGERHVGDDAAVLQPFLGEAIISTDVSVLGVHLEETLFPLEDLGYKAVMAALSDLAAMGARPRGLVVAVTAPPGTDLDALHHGVAEAARLTSTPVVGGDLSRGREVSVAVTVFGECPGRGAVLRSGARAGDVVLVTGPLGRAAAGLRRRRDGAPLSDERVEAHRRPWPRLREGMAARASHVHAMIDLSDGIGLDLHRLADASSVGFALEDLPVADGATEEEAISGGEDYELLIATNDPGRLKTVFCDRGLREPLAIGVVVQDSLVRTFRGEVFERRGFEHEL
ncbi:MAG: Thiamine-monophosphate kinase [Acidimicrobiaceae bacterium]|nr:Thiamine-monophosphate kinase [Acidimicrobiaceae bacterium]